MVKAVDSWLRGRGFKPPTEEIIYSGNIHLDQKPGVEINLELLHMHAILQKGRVDFEDGWFIKSSFITKDEIKLVS